MMVYRSRARPTAATFYLFLNNKSFRGDSMEKMPSPLLLQVRMPRQEDEKDETLEIFLNRSSRSRSNHSNKECIFYSGKLLQFIKHN